MPPKVRKYGWIPDSPDRRDLAYVPPRAIVKNLPEKSDLRPLCPPVYNQLQCGSCTANAIGGAVEFCLIKQKAANIFVPSRLFLYYNERVINNNVMCDSGAPIRDGIKSVASQGDCPEELWPYHIEKFDVRPPKKCYSEARKYKSVIYYRIVRNLDHMKACLASGFPFIFGMSVHSSFEGTEVEKTGHLHMPTPTEKPAGHHAVLAVGYDDARNWFLVRNSWGSAWGMGGYFTIPYEYLMDERLSADFWTIRIVT
jgi:C1A family cysteine protease